ncbi:hypothetical protein HELRODRAFT_138302, partial [Helobdella robusta]|uniref:Uncharacterized protein n=1 Tax=Helobdella robusta TaxID=6412 RepID=T1EIT0_HELRO
CLMHEFSCTRGRCVSRHFLCDKIFDCPYGDDESPQVCGKCRFNEYRCKGERKKCISNYFVCDSKADCPVGDDEDSC